MKIKDIVIEDIQVKNKVIRALSKVNDENPIFSNIYKLIVGTPLESRIQSFIKNRNDPDAIAAMKYLTSVIPTLGSVDQIKGFLKRLNDGEDFINTQALVPQQSMTAPASVVDLVNDPFAEALFYKIFHEFAGKGDAGPGEAALAILSPNIKYGKPGDIVVGNVKVEVKAARGEKGAAGRIWDTPLHQKPILDILTKAVPGATSFSVLDGNKPFPVPELSKKFITTASRTWFGRNVPEVITTFGTPAFAGAWQATVFDAYKAHGQWDGMLAIGVKTYQYIRTGPEFAQYMAKINQGTICRAGAKQSRELAPQIAIR